MNIPSIICCLLFSCQVMSDSFVIPQTAAHQAPLSMGFPRQEYWSGLPFPSPGDLPNPGIESMSPALHVDSLPLRHLGSEVKWREVAQSCPTLCDPMDCGPPGSLAHGIFQAWILEWVAIYFCRESSWPREAPFNNYILNNNVNKNKKNKASSSSPRFHFIIVLHKITYLTHLAPVWL